MLLSLNDDPCLPKQDERTQLYEDALLPLLSPQANRTHTPSPRHLRSKRGPKSQSLNNVAGSGSARHDRVLREMWLDLMLLDPILKCVCLAPVNSGLLLLFFSCGGLQSACC